MPNAQTNTEGDTNNKHSAHKAWSILFKSLKHYKPCIFIMVALGVFSALANGIVPFIIGSFLDSLINTSLIITLFGKGIRLWFLWLLVWVVIQLIANIVDWILDRKGRALHMRIHLGYQSKAFAYLLLLPLSFHKDEKIGELSELVSKTSWQIASIADRVLINLTPQVLSVMVGFIVTFFINPIFTLVLFIGVSIYLAVLIKLVAPTTKLLEHGHSTWTHSYADAIQAVSNIQSVKHMTAETYEIEKIENNFMGRTLSLWYKLQYIWSGVNFYQRIIVLATQAVIFFLSVFLIEKGKLSIGELVALNGYAGLVFGPFVMLGHEWQTLQNGLVSIEQSDTVIFSKSPEVYSPKDCFAPISLNGAVQFKNVSFAYSTETPILKNLNFEVKRGECVAFVGKSGVGKSTAIDLLSGYYFPTQGSVLIDGHDTREFDLLALRKGIAVVPQEPTLFNSSIMMNIRYGRMEASDSEVMNAAKQASANEFIEKLPKGYEELVGERGVKLSVGQKQRIAIARAILKNPSILVLDEPTSALDAETENIIAKSFERLMKDRTTFIIAHRLSTVRQADKIFVFQKGEIVEHGTHEDLMKIKHGVYKQLHDYQIGLY